MAWRSSGSTHTEMVDNLKGNGLIQSEHIERGFRQVDRNFFVPKGNEEYAYSDQPLREGNIHISAPHIYCSALEVLELQPESSLSFLNIGSGTGYLSCIVAEILGPKSLNFGVEIHEDVIQHCQESIKNWKNARAKSACGKRQAGSMTSNPEKFCPPHIEILHGNGLNISSTSGESVVGFDRIYIGASVDSLDVMELKQLLSPGGILVGPVDDELVKVIRIGSSESLKENSRRESDFTTQIISGVRFAPLLMYPTMEVTIPTRIWQPFLHTTFPVSFQKASMQLLLCSNAQYIQGSEKEETSLVNLAATLPRDVWIHILSFTHRKWFEPKQSEVDYLKMRLREEQANTEKAQQACMEAESKVLIAERERDIYRMLANRWQSRLRVVLDRHPLSSTTASDITDNNTRNEEELASPQGNVFDTNLIPILDMGTILQQIQNDLDDFEQFNDDDDDDEQSGHFYPAEDDTMQEVERHNHQHDSHSLEGNQENADVDIVPAQQNVSMVHQGLEDRNTSSSADAQMTLLNENTRQSRTVSISSSDF